MEEAEITFTCAVKHEIVENYSDEINGISIEDMRPLLAGFAKVNGRLNFSQSGDSLYFNTENAKIAKFVFLCFNKRYKISTRFSYVKNMRFTKKTTYYIIAESKVQEIIEDLKILDFSGKELQFIKGDKMISLFFTGVFLASGSVNSPKRSNYHLEIAFGDEEDALFAQKLLNKVRSVKFYSHIIKRRSQYVLYLKKSNQIADFLSFINAKLSCLEFENFRVARDYANNNNRLDICETANTRRTVESAKRQMKDIEIIEKKIGLDNIPNEKMRLVCQIRKESEEDTTMEQIANQLSLALECPVSKSSVNHTFRSIHELAKRLSKGEEK